MCFDVRNEKYNCVFNYYLRVLWFVRDKVLWKCFDPGFHFYWIFNWIASLNWVECWMVKIWRKLNSWSASISNWWKLNKAYKICWKTNIFEIILRFNRFLAYLLISWDFQHSKHTQHLLRNIHRYVLLFSINVYSHFALFSSKEWFFSDGACSTQREKKCLD